MKDLTRWRGNRTLRCSFLLKSSQGDQLTEEVEEAYQSLCAKGCCKKRCAEAVEFEELYDQVLNLRGQSATSHKAMIMGVLMARR